jgi:trk system potassium uptake protein
MMLMQIIILGAGQVGNSLAASLVVEQHSVTVVDLDDERLHELQSQYDLRTVKGHCALPATLAEAGAESAEMIIAVTHDDETNIVACFVAATTFKIPLKIARVRAPGYFNERNNFFAKENSPIDVFINPAKLITHSLVHLIKYPGALRVFDFLDERVKLVASKLNPDSPLLGKPAHTLREFLPNVAAKIIAIYRNNQEMPLEDTSITLEDDVLFIASREQINAVLHVLNPTLPQRSKRITIIGGGYIGTQLARTLENDYQVKLIEQDRARCEQLAQELKNTLVLHGNGCDSNLLRNEDIETTDCFCALSNSDADNIVSSLYSKQLGAGRVIALINRDAYLNLIISGYIDLDIALSPQQITTSAILKHLRHGNIIQAYSLRRGAAEALEIMTPGRSKIIGQTLGTVLPNGISVAAIGRGEELIIADSSTTVQTHDRVILFISDKSKIQTAERLFAVQAEA